MCKKEHEAVNEICIFAHHLPPVSVGNGKGELFISRQARKWMNIPFNIERLSMESFDVYEDDEMFYVLIACPKDLETPLDVNIIEELNEALGIEVIRALQKQLKEIQAR